MGVTAQSPLLLSYFHLHPKTKWSALVRYPGRVQGPLSCVSQMVLKSLFYYNGLIKPFASKSLMYFVHILCISILSFFLSLSSIIVLCSSRQFYFYFHAMHSYRVLSRYMKSKPLKFRKESCNICLSETDLIHFILLSLVHPHS